MLCDLIDRNDAHEAWPVNPLPQPPALNLGPDRGLDGELFGGPRRQGAFDALALPVRFA